MTFLCVFRSPYFDHDAFMHHTMHVLDAPDVNNYAKYKKPWMILIDEDKDDKAEYGGEH